MIRIRQSRHVALALSLFVLTLPGILPAQWTPPVAKVIPKVDTLHGDVRVDNYFWLRDRNNPEVIRYLEAENAYTDSSMKHTTVLQEKLYKEFLSRIKQTDLTVPERIGDYYYYSRTIEGKQYSILARKKGSLDAPEEIILDQNEMAEGRKYFKLGTTRISPDQNLYAFTVDTAGSEWFTLMVKDLRTGKILTDRVDNVHFSLAWANDNKTLFYTKTDSAQRPDQIFRHTLGEDQSKDVRVYHEPDVLFRVAIFPTKDKKYLLLSTSSFTQSEYRYLPADRPGDDWKMIQPRTKELEYDVEHHGNRFLIVTNDKAVNFKVMWAPESDPTRKNWKDLIAHRDSVLIDGIDVFKDHLVVYERERALRQIRVQNLATGRSYRVDFPEPVYTVFGANNPEHDTKLVRFVYTSLVTPSSVFDFDMTTRKRELKKQTEVLGGYDKTLYATERTWARAPDGVMVPVSLVYKKSLVKDGKRPMLLYSYGSYGSSTDPTFSSNNLSLLDRGFIYAIAHIRGGQELGRWWYDQGKMLNKKNTFTDFIAAAEHLIKEGYTSKERLAIRGGSAGGLLMGAVMTMRPDLFKAVVADVPFVDVINTMMDGSIPLTAGEWEQWGNPQVKEHYAYMLSYSPYDQVKNTAYPILLVTTGLNDPRVAYWEPAKWVAKLRAMKTDNNMLLLKTHMGAGHGGSSGRYDNLRELAFRYAFILNALGVTEPENVSVQ
ncbi:MAG TPA: S9 family peptidase [Gemmatimonadaceae bacterium]|nr:S9 family peptidase [Gemmatimonadaceae bacterium]